ncbi:MAG: hypothetical protein RLO21_22365 [Nitratireductor sp.]|uniref:hypothetical protein n=1 Tax=Nitratireductor rhodophyticola TaxID=2854036 RepID=UPI00300A4B2D
MTSNLEDLARRLYTDNKGRSWADESWEVRDRWMGAARERFDANGQRLPAGGQPQGPTLRASATPAESAITAEPPDTRRKKSGGTLSNRRSMSERRAEETDTNARRILHNEERERREKTERLKRARIAAELEATKDGLR